METLLTPEEIAGRLQLNVVTIYRWLRSGKLKGYHISRKCWRIAPEVFRKFMSTRPGSLSDSEIEYASYYFERELPEGRSPENIPRIKRDLQPLQPDKREWLWLKWSGFRRGTSAVSGDPLVIGQEIAMRSDGQTFYVNVTINERPTDRYCAALVDKLIAHLESFRDCSCGIIGSVGPPQFPRDISIHSPCEKHKRMDTVEQQLEYAKTLPPEDEEDEE